MHMSASLLVVSIEPQKVYSGIIYTSSFLVCLHSKGVCEWCIYKNSQSQHYLSQWISLGTQITRDFIQMNSWINQTVAIIPPQASL